MPGLLVLIGVLVFLVVPPSVRAAAGWFLAAVVATGATWFWSKVQTKGRARAEPASGPGFATLALVAENTTSPVVITDLLGRIDWVNDAFTRLTGYELAEALGRQPGRLLQDRKSVV